MEMEHLVIPPPAQATHSPDMTVSFDHPAFGGYVAHGHVIKEAWGESAKEAMARHIDQFHRRRLDGDTDRV